MSYRVGGGLWPTGGDPHVICDGCGKIESAMKDWGGPKLWVLDRKKVPGWFKIIRHEFSREDYCSEACSKRAEAKTEGSKPR